MKKIIKLELAVVHCRNWKWFSRCKIENFLKAVVGRNIVKPAHCTAQYYFKECIKLGFCSITHSRPSLWDPMDCSTPGFPVLHNLPEVVQTHVHWVSDAIQPFRHLLLPSWLQTFPASGVFSNELALCIRWPKNWSFSFSISPSNEYSGLISFTIGLVGSPCSPRDSQESSPTPQFKSINSSVLSLL